MVFFDTREIDTKEVSIQDGFHEFMITKIEDKENEKCKMISVELQMINRNQKCWDSIIYEHNTSKEAQDIGRKRLAQMCESAFGEKIVINDLDIFINKIVWAYIKNQEYNGKNYPKPTKYIKQEEFQKIRGAQASTAPQHIRKVAASVPPVQSQNSGNPFEGDDVPF